MLRMRESRGDQIFGMVNAAFVTLLLVIVLYPLIYVLSCSISDPGMVGTGQVWLLPKGFTLEGYARVLRDKNIITGYMNTTFYTVVGTCLNLFVTLPAAYALSKKSLPGRGLLMIFFMITMYFSGGLVPTFLLVQDMGLFNTRLVLLLLGAMSVYNVIIARTFFVGLPKELEEAAFIDGCSRTRTFIQIVLPLSKALIGVLALYYGITHWNAYFTALIYITDISKKTLQIFLREILVLEQTSENMMELSEELAHEKEMLKHLIKYSVIVVSSVPVLVVYPFLQKYFDRGVLLGSLKG